MALESASKPVAQKPDMMPRDWILLLLRLLAFGATASAAVVMALNKQTKTIVVATIGTTPIKTTLTAKFQHTPAFVFFVVANGLVSIHNLLTVVMSLLGGKFDSKGLFSPVMTAIFDMLNATLVAGGANAAVYMAELGKNGNSHARWDKICDKFETFCNHGGGALIASFVGLILMLVISVMSIIKLVKPKSTHHLIEP